MAHSISPLLHNNVIKNMGLDACYIRTFLKNGDDIIRKFNHLRLSGANVTVPHKENACLLCDEARGISKDIGAVNTLVKENNKIIGYNTDAQGFFESIKSFKNIKSALILGAGGTAKAIAFILRKNGIIPTILNRSSKRLIFFKKNGFKSFSWDDFTQERYDLIINTTSAGLKDENLPLEENLLNKIMQNSNYAFDVIYGKTTPFMRLAHSNDLLMEDGSQMLINQAVLAFNLFYQNRFAPKTIKSYMQKASFLS